MKSIWQKFPKEEIHQKVFQALSQNVNYRQANVLGVPGTFLDQEVFPVNEPFLKKAPFLSTMVANPNHIGVHTLHQSEHFFGGTQQLEKEVIQICGEEIFGAEKDSIDGYVASGGTEANIEGVWIYRNYYMQEFGAKLNEITLLYSEDSHYSFSKSANLLQIDSAVVPVDEHRSIDVSALAKIIEKKKLAGANYFIISLNLSTTMFGSVDDIEMVSNYIRKHQLNAKIHIDAAFGGFMYPFTTDKNLFTFRNDLIFSIAIDAHKMLQTPYGTGIFLVRKSWLKYVCNDAANYVQGNDHTLIGSRSGANAVAIWMVLQSYGPEGWKNKMLILKSRTDRLCAKLNELQVQYFRNPAMNIVTFPQGQIPEKIAHDFHLVPDKWNSRPDWWKIVVMEHVSDEIIDNFMQQLQNAKTNKVV